MFKIRPALAAIALLASLPAANAQTTTQDHDAHHPDTNAPGAPTAPAAPQSPAGMSSGGMGMDKMMGGNMEQMMPMMQQMMRSRMMSAGMPDMGPTMARGGMALQHIEGQIAFYKAELYIMDAQTAPWDAFADTLRANAKRLQDAYKAALPGTGLPPVPNQLAQRRQWLTAELESLRIMEPAASALYAVLSAEQKKTADELVADHLRRM